MTFYNFEKLVYITTSCFYFSNYTVKYYNNIFLLQIYIGFINEANYGWKIIILPAPSTMITIVVDNTVSILLCSIIYLCIWLT